MFWCSLSVCTSLKMFSQIDIEETFQFNFLGSVLRLRSIVSEVSNSCNVGKGGGYELW